MGGDGIGGALLIFVTHVPLACANQQPSASAVGPKHTDLPTPPSGLIRGRGSGVRGSILPN